MARVMGRHPSALCEPTDPAVTGKSASSDVRAGKCSAPIVAALRAMQRVTGYTAVPYLVSEHDFAALAAAYGADAPVGGDAPPVRALPVDSIHAAAQRIAATALDEGTVQLAQAYVEPLTWVRVAGPHRVEALFVSPRGRHTEDETWQAAITRH